MTQDDTFKYVLLSSCWVALRPAVFDFGMDLAGCASALEISSCHRAPFPRLLPPLGDLLHAAWDAPFKGYADGADGIFGNACRVWTAALRPDPH